MQLSAQRHILLMFQKGTFLRSKKKKAKPKKTSL